MTVKGEIVSEKRGLSLISFYLLGEKTMSAFLDQVRDASAYPVFRGVTTLLQLVGYLAAVVAAIVGFNMGKGAIILGLIAAVIIAIVTRLFAEMSLMLADIADTVIQSAARMTQKTETEGSRSAPATKEATEVANVTKEAAVGAAISQRYSDPGKLRFTCPQCATDLFGDEEICYKCNSILNAPGGWRPVPKPR